MILPEFIRRIIEITLDQYCEERVPEVARDQVQMTYRISENNVTLYEKCRTYLDLNDWLEVPIAQFQYDAVSRKWTLYCTDRDSRWHLYWETAPNADFDILLEEADRWLKMPPALSSNSIRLDKKGNH